MADALRAVIASGGNPYAQSRDRLLAAVITLRDAAQRPEPCAPTSRRPTC
jgi:hypothetical protein